MLGRPGYDSAFRRNQANGLKSIRHRIAQKCGQYNTMRPNIHMMPEESSRGWIDLERKAFGACTLEQSSRALALRTDHGWTAPQLPAARTYRRFRSQLRFDWRTGGIGGNLPKKQRRVKSPLMIIDGFGISERRVSPAFENPEALKSENH